MGIPVIYIDAGHAKAALDMARSKTDANVADRVAHLTEVGFYRAVRVKGFESMLTRTLLGACHQLPQMTTQLSNQIRSVIKTFGLIVPAGTESKFTKMYEAFLLTVLLCGSSQTHLGTLMPWGGGGHIIRAV